MSENLSLREQGSALLDIARFRPLFTVGLIGLSLFTAVLEGIGLSFILPIVELAQEGEASGGRFIDIFVTMYDAVGIPLTLETAILGVVAVMAVRYTSSFLVSWLRVKLETEYGRKLQQEAFDGALDAELAYYDEYGTDEILNAIITQADKGGGTIMHVVNLIEQLLLAGVYFAIAVLISPVLTAVAIFILGIVVLLTRLTVESGVSVGGRVADANEEIQESVQAGTQGIRDVRLFGLQKEIFSRFSVALEKYVRASVKIGRNQAALENLYQFSVAITVFFLIYLAITFSSLGIELIGVFLFAIFRLGPRLSNVNMLYYRIESNLPHLIRTLDFIDELESNKESMEGEVPVPESIELVEFDEVEFNYNPEDAVLQEVSFTFAPGEFVAFVGPSGAGKSTIVSLLAGLYRPISGEIRCNDTPIRRFDNEEWRKKLAVVRQHPYIFNDTLRANLTVGNRDASEERIERVCETAQITEFLDELPEGLDSEVGDDGVRLSGGQRQRVAIARALLKDAELILLDEATSDLDTQLERKIHDGIEARETEAGLLVVAHRLSTVTNSDRIYVVENGEIVERGPHQELLAEGAAYARLHGVQSVE